MSSREMTFRCLLLIERLLTNIASEVLRTSWLIVNLDFGWLGGSEIVMLVTHSSSFRTTVECPESRRFFSQFVNILSGR